MAVTYGVIVFRCPYCNETHTFSSGTSYRVHKCRYHKGLEYKKPIKGVRKATVVEMQKMEVQSRAQQTRPQQATWVDDITRDAVLGALKGYLARQKTQDEQ